MVYSSALEQKQLYNAPELKSLINSKRFSDVTFVLDDGNKVYANKGILVSRSEYFRALFKVGEVKHAEADALEVRVEHISYDIFLNVMEFLYTGETDIIDDNAMQLIEAADLFILTELKERAGAILMLHIDSSTALKLLKFADQMRLTQLQTKCISFLRENLHSDPLLQIELKQYITQDNSDLILAILTSQMGSVNSNNTDAQLPSSTSGAASSSHPAHTRAATARAARRANAANNGNNTGNPGGGGGGGANGGGGGGTGDAHAHLHFPAINNLPFDVTILPNMLHNLRARPDT